MQISVDVHNYMETLVGHVLATEEYVSIPVIIEGAWF